MEGLIKPITVEYKVLYGSIKTPEEGITYHTLDTNISVIKVVVQGIKGLNGVTIKAVIVPPQGDKIELPLIVGRAYGEIVEYKALFPVDIQGTYTVELQTKYKDQLITSEPFTYTVEANIG